MLLDTLFLCDCDMEWEIMEIRVGSSMDIQYMIGMPRYLSAEFSFAILLLEA